MPPDGMWCEPVGIWEGILNGKLSPAGRYISVAQAIRLIAKAAELGSSMQASDWCGSEGGTPRRLEDDSGTPIFCAGESISARDERIASEVGDRKLDQQHDNEQL